MLTVVTYFVRLTFGWPPVWPVLIKQIVFKFDIYFLKENMAGIWTRDTESKVQTNTYTELPRLPHINAINMNGGTVVGFLNDRYVLISNHLIFFAPFPLFWMHKCMQ